jgi:hypothetical protein
MVGAGDEADRAAVLDTVRRFFGDDGASGDELLAGWLLEFSRLIAEPEVEPSRDAQPPGALTHERTLTRAEIVELGPDRTVVDVRAVLSWKAVHGSHRHAYESRGPMVLEKIDRTWRIVDFDVEGMPRSTSIVVGTLAEQRREGATARVVALDRAPVGTAFVVELDDTGAGPMTLSNAYALVENKATWARLATKPKTPVPAGGSRRYYASSAVVVPITESLMAIALDVRAGSHRLPFVIRVPPTPPEELVPQPPPLRLPVLRNSSPRSLLVAAAITLGLAWWYGWVALLVPIYVGLDYYRRVRKAGRLPAPLRPIRHLVDAAVIAAGFLLLWETPAEWFAVPYLVAVAAYLVLAPLGRRHEQMRILTAFTAGLLWLILLGLPTERLPPCRIADGNPADVARVFSSALASGDVVHASRVTRHATPLKRRDVSLLYRPVSGSTLRELHHGDPASRFCSAFRGVVARCYRYGPAPPASLGQVLIVGVSCDGKAWRVEGWI